MASSGPQWSVTLAGCQWPLAFVGCYRHCSVLLWGLSMPGLSNLTCSGAWTKSGGRDLQVLQQRGTLRWGLEERGRTLEFLPKGATIKSRTVAAPEVEERGKRRTLHLQFHHTGCTSTRYAVNRLNLWYRLRVPNLYSVPAAVDPPH